MSEFTDCVWYRNGLRAKQKADRVSYCAAEPMYIVLDTKIGMYGVGIGRAEPDWCRENDGFRLIRVVHPSGN